MNNFVQSRILPLITSITAAAVLASNTPVNALTYTYTTIDDPNGTDGTFARGINNAGQIVGYYYDSSNNSHGFLDTNGSFTTINNPNSSISETYTNDGTFAYGINDAGQIVGYYYDSSNNSHGFLDTNGSFTTIDDPSSANGTFAYGINNAGQIIGSYFPVSGLLIDGFLDTNGSFTNINDPNLYFPYVNYNVIQSLAYGINNTSQIVDTTYGDVPVGFLDTNGSFTTIYEPNSYTTEPYGINDAGQIVGLYADSSNLNGHGFLATPDTTAVPFDIPGGATIPALGSVLALGVMRKIRKFTSNNLSKHGTEKTD